MVDIICSDPRSKDGCDELSGMVDRDISEDDIYEYDDDYNIIKTKSKNVPICMVDAFMHNPENKMFEYPAFEFTEMKGKEKEEFYASLNKKEKYMLIDVLKEYPNAGYVVIRDCIGNDGKKFTYWDNYAEMGDENLSDIINWHKYSTSHQCKTPIVALQDGTVWNGKQVIKKDPLELYTRIIAFTWE